MAPIRIAFRLFLAASAGFGCGAAAYAADVAGPAAIDAAHVAKLAVAFTLKSEAIGAEVAPLATSGGRLLLLTPYPQILTALEPADDAPRVAWRYGPPSDPAASGLGCCDRPQHGPVVDGRDVFFTTQDGRVASVDAATGQARWVVQLAEPKRGETMAGPPVVAGERIVAGNAGDDFGVRGWVAALDRRDGRTVWKRYSTGPDADVGIASGDAGVTTWLPEGWPRGGGSVATGGLLDPASPVIYHETGHASPWNPDQRLGQGRFTSGLFARDLADGRARWFVPFDDDNPYARRASGADALGKSSDGKAVVVHADASGFLFVVDRANGSVVSADRFLPGAQGEFDAKSGRIVYPTDRKPQPAQQTRDVCPAWTGAVGNEGLAAVPGGTVVIVAASRLCMDYEPRTVNPVDGLPQIGANVRMKLPPGQPGGALIAWDYAARRALWRVDERLPLLGGPLIVNDLAFYGTLDGRLEAVDVRTGERRWHHDVGAGIVSKPIAWQAADGTSWLAVVAGASRMQGMVANGSIDSRDQTSGLGLGALLPRLPQERERHGTVVAFRLK